MSLTIPVTRVEQATAVAITMEHPQPVIGPSRHSVQYMLAQIRTDVIDALAVLGWIIGLIILLAALSPTFEGHLEHYAWYIVSGRDE